jgi:hydroxymethylglutaryl-CoA lyase
MMLLERAHAMWDDVGIPVRRVSFTDTMGWNQPHLVKETVLRTKDKWPDLTDWRFHIHDARGTALATLYTIMDCLTPEDTVHWDSTIGGCPYGGHGRATAMAPTEDLLNMLDEMGVETGIDLNKVIECVWMLEEVIGRSSFGHVSKAGPAPKHTHELFNPNMPFVETYEQAKHFLQGSSAYEGGINPWREPITSPFMDRLNKGLPAYTTDPNDWPWNADFWPKSSKNK